MMFQFVYAVRSLPDWLPDYPFLLSLASLDGKEITLSPPSGDELPAKGFDPGSDTYQAPPSGAQRAALSVKV